MLNKELTNWVLNNEWIEEIEPGKLGNTYLEETYRLKENAPQDVKDKWEYVCELFREVR